MQNCENATKMGIILGEEFQKNRANTLDKGEIMC